MTTEKTAIPSFPFTPAETSELDYLCQRLHALCAPHFIGVLLPCVDRVEDVPGTNSLLYTPSLGLVLVDHGDKHPLAKATAQNAIAEMERQNQRIATHGEDHSLRE